ncbi:N-acetyltransferase [Micromonospora sp. DT46]|uniref:N-acetyltransferase n=1 Tax=unclassified Micromonospora TaxID=2617518 RepID=UPI001CEC630A|nr:N-acetyltransferase [Micromonospora sp. AMSO12t]
MRVLTLAERPDLRDAMLHMEASWPEYIPPEPMVIGWAFDRYPEHQLVVVESDDKVVARAAGVPFAWDGDPASLPDTGWDAVLGMSMLDTSAGRDLTALCALEIAVVPGMQARNMSGRVLAAVKDNARRHGYRDVVGPVRPSGKHAEPHEPMPGYAARTRDDGLPADPWLRVHVRAGGQVLQVCPASMTISGSLAQWRDWTGLPFDTSGPVVVPGALTPVAVNVDHDHAVYVEPNVWVRHPLAERHAS